MLQQDEIIEMAVSNGFYKNDEGTITSPFIEDVDISELLLGFAEDVAAKERDALLDVVYGYARSLSWNEDFQADIRARGEK